MNNASDRKVLVSRDHIGTHALGEVSAIYLAERYILEVLERNIPPHSQDSAAADCRHLILQELYRPTELPNKGLLAIHL